MGLKIVTILLAIAGLMGTAVPRVPGLPIIFLATVFYGAFSGFRTFTTLLEGILVLLLFVGEVGGRWLRIYLTHRFSLSRQFSVHSTVTSGAGILACDALFGSVPGLLLWSIIAGKSLLPTWRVTSQIIACLCGAFLFRLLIGSAMMSILILYILDA